MQMLKLHRLADDSNLRNSQLCFQMERGICISDLKKFTPIHLTVRYTVFVDGQYGPFNRDTITRTMKQ